MKALIWLVDKAVIACLAEMAGAARAERTERAATMKWANIMLLRSLWKTGNGETLLVQGIGRGAFIYAEGGE